MDPNKNGDSSNMKGKNVVGEMDAPADPNPIRYIPPPARPFYPMHDQQRHNIRHVSTALRLGIGSSLQNPNGNTNGRPDVPSTSVRRPSYTMLPAFVDPPERLPSFMLQQQQHINIAPHVQGNQVRTPTVEMQLREENRALWRRIRDLEQRVTELTHEEEVGESTSVDPNRMEPIMLECRMCVLRRAAVMLWPCRHVCVCLACDVATTRCPVCGVSKTSSFRVNLPTS